MSTQPAAVAVVTERPAVVALPEAVVFGREVCGDLSSAEQREWLVTNGIGGFACGTVAGALTRRYHGLLTAALEPPLGRTLLVAKVEETAAYDGRSYALSTNRWSGGFVDPHGYRHIERFRLEGTTPVWAFACGDALLEKRVWMAQGSNTTYVRYELTRGSEPLTLTVKALVNYRDYHGITQADDWRFQVRKTDRGVRVIAYDGAVPFYLGCDQAEFSSAHVWYHNFHLPLERFRGLEHREDHLHAGTFKATLRAGESFTFAVTTDPDLEIDPAGAWEARTGRERLCLALWSDAQGKPAAAAPAWVKQLVLAADQFVVTRPLPDDPGALSVIAGYPWFGDWGRDTMVALPGLTITTGRPEIARRILRTFARFVDRGMLPNYFPDAGSTPEYNTVDAALWFVEAVRQYHAATRDAQLLAEVFPVLQDIVRLHAEGTRYGIRMDADGLLRAGEPGVQLTWMDAKVGDWVVTPRTGKAVEVNALWHNALETMAQFARLLNQPAGEFAELAARVRDSFVRFWNEAAGYCFDVIDGPEGNDAALRPNQIFAVSLQYSPLAPDLQRAVVDACARHLLTSFGLRSLAAGQPRYRDHYGGGPAERDGAYHQGTVWGWLLGPFAIAHLRVYRSPAAAACYLRPLADHLLDHGLGSISEIFDAEPPFTPRGCFAQAWSVAETLRAWAAVASGRLEDC